jgi:hypothetical protein
MSRRSWYLRRAADSPSPRVLLRVQRRPFPSAVYRGLNCERSKRIYVKLRMEMPRNVGLMLIPQQRLRSTRIGQGIPAQGWERDIR